jgi:hypothetical protein
LPVFAGRPVRGAFDNTFSYNFGSPFSDPYDTLTAMKTNDHALLEAALVGYQHQLNIIEAKMAELRQQLGGKSPAAASKSAAAAPAAGKKRQMSSAARKRIAAAQKKRWAEYHRLRAKA